MEVEKEFDHKYDKATLLFLLHFMPAPKLDERFVDDCVKQILERLKCYSNTQESFSDTNPLDLQLPKDKPHAA